MITNIQRVYVRRYRDSGQVTAYVEWTDARGKSGRTEGACRIISNIQAWNWRANYELGDHMAALFTRAQLAGLSIERDDW